MAARDRHDQWPQWTTGIRRPARPPARKPPKRTDPTNPTKLAELVRVADARWVIEETFQAAKGQTGLDHYHVRQYTGCYRHITLSGSRSIPP
ncbi:hypothetical protein D1J51_07370 [Leucobacter sp. wl10]|nr:hypothetical protein D1J51_07370 [Leucobacter sp. wl10]